MAEDEEVEMARRNKILDAKSPEDELVRRGELHRILITYTPILVPV